MTSASISAALRADAAGRSAPAPGPIRIDPILLSPSLPVARAPARCWRAPFDPAGSRYTTCTQSPPVLSGDSWAFVPVRFSSIIIGTPLITPE